MNLILKFAIVALLVPVSESRWWGWGQGDNGGGGNGGGHNNGGGHHNGGGNGGNGGGGNGCGIALGTGTLDEEERSTIIFMREEEKFSRDVYLTLAALYDRPVFFNIARSEQHHMDQMEDLINAYNLDDPVLDESTGVFQNGNLQTLYITLVARGRESLLEALEVGALIEEMDIDDLNKAIQDSDQSDLDTVYGCLRRASYNHLRAFVRNVESLGVTYTAQHLSQPDVDAILNN
ncbi:Uncharacterized protein domain (DUF2202) [Seminavis robusta]|uniref:Uncharacterized protein domain (DUF2202) n=1 Tax=Seminavis robusta TaxID=568900 RepID=A0A9N8F412_9STRA|nr:Uncharacterized protein domain (DUF2202) [Seminavis robusta]|eukprot:Sro3448_g348150.1 Uncharacterized protein domain (DUF2202) (234) ;mRNA; r:4944-5645